MDREVLNRLDMSALTRVDIDAMSFARPVRPSRWHDYTFETHCDMKESGLLWDEFPPVIPYGIIDGRISDLAINFWDSPDERLLTGYRRLEDIVRRRTGIDEHGTKLFSQAFLGKAAKLIWTGIGDNEIIGRGNLFTATYMANRNPRAHQEQSSSGSAYLGEFLQLNYLYVLEKEAIDCSVAISASAV